MPLDPNSTTPSGDDDNLPLWRQHFPIDSEADASRSRREFLGGAAVAGGAMTCGQLALNQLSPESSAVDKTSKKEHEPHVLEKNFNELAVGESFLFHYPNEKSPCVLVKLSEDKCVAFQQKCTHLACPVVPEFETNEFHCPCHHGAFDLRTGEPKAGPPRRPLHEVHIEKSADGTMTAVAILV